MKTRTLFLAVIAVLFTTSCSNDLDEISNNTSEKKQETERMTRAAVIDTLNLDEVEPYLPSEEELNRAYLYAKKVPHKAASLPSITDEDDFFSSNMVAIRELPVTIRVRQAASGADAKKVYFYCDGTNKEVTLTQGQYASANKFYIRVLPASAGVPYMIYSNYTKTPLCVGQFKKKPYEKILMANQDASGTVTTYGWNLTPANTKGYFAIQSVWYMGQSSTNSKSYFYYVLETNKDNKIRYAQRVNNKAQQEFLIKPNMAFTVDSLAYDLKNATVATETPISKSFIDRNEYEYEINKNVDADLTAEETSLYQEKEGLLKIDINKGINKFQRPIAEAGIAIFGEKSNKDAEYVTTTQKFNRYYSYKVNIDFKSRCQLRMTVKYRLYSLSVPYVVYAKYNDRVVRIAGVWKGTFIPDPNIYKPEIITRFYDLDTGEERY